MTDRERNRAIDDAADVRLADAHEDDRFDADVLLDIEAYEAEAEDDEGASAPTAQEAREACQMFADLASDAAVAAFEAWLEGLEYERFRQVSRAIDVLRGALAEYRGDVGLRDVADRID